MTMKLGDMNGAWAILLKVTLVTVPISVAGVGWIANSTIINSRDIASIRAMQFTSKEGLEVWQAIADVRERLARMPTAIPPTWFIERVDKIDQRLTRIENRLVKIDSE